VAITRIHGRVAVSAASTCETLRANGHLRSARLRRGRCRAKWLFATGTEHWTFALRHRLPPGGYVIMVRAIRGSVKQTPSRVDGSLLRLRLT
jgi:hypothetical protein